jgi:hypothetical protein
LAILASALRLMASGLVAGMVATDNARNIFCQSMILFLQNCKRVRSVRAP